MCPSNDCMHILEQYISYLSLLDDASLTEDVLPSSVSFTVIAATRSCIELVLVPSSYHISQYDTACKVEARMAVTVHGNMLTLNGTHLLEPLKQYVHHW